MQPVQLHLTCEKFGFFAATSPYSKFAQSLTVEVADFQFAALWPYLRNDPLLLWGLVHPSFLSFLRGAMLCSHSPVSCQSLHMVPLAFLPILNIPSEMNITSEMITSAFLVKIAFFSRG
jgi:hypothetical protein